MILAFEILFIVPCVALCIVLFFNEQIQLSSVAINLQNLVCATRKNQNYLSKPARYAKDLLPGAENGRKYGTKLNIAAKNAETAVI